MRRRICQEKKRRDTELCTRIDINDIRFLLTNFMYWVSQKKNSLRLAHCVNANEPECMHFLVQFCDLLIILLFQPVCIKFWSDFPAKKVVHFILRNYKWSRK